MKIYVIGTGTMAKGIVKAFAAKMPVVMKSRTQASLDKAMASIEKGYAKLVEKGNDIPLPLPHILLCIQPAKPLLPKACPRLK